MTGGSFTFPYTDARRSLRTGQLLENTGVTAYAGHAPEGAKVATSDEMGSNAERELGAAWSRDLGRAIDCSETRSDFNGGQVFRLRLHRPSPSRPHGLVPNRHV